MPIANTPDKRTRLIDAATALVHSQGYARTSLADIAQAADVPLGNVYYYFKSKDALGEALIERRDQGYRDACREWDKLRDPKARLKAFIRMTTEQSELLVRQGCPVGSLCAELGKDAGPLATRAAGIFGDLVAWLQAQFSALGHSRVESGDLAVHLMSALQGATLLAHAFGQARPLEREAARLLRWLNEI